MDAINGCDGCEFVHGCEVVDAMRCDAMRCDTPPDIVEQTTHERKNNSGSFNNQIRSVAFFSDLVISCHVISCRGVTAGQQDSGMGRYGNAM
jgi:hypothetical protein